MIHNNYVYIIIIFVASKTCIYNKNAERIRNKKKRNTENDHQNIIIGKQVSKYETEFIATKNCKKKK